MAAQTVVQEYYVPMPEAQIRQSFLILSNRTGTTMESVVSIVTGSPGTKMIYDHWEDGYEIDLDNPTQSSTEVWGDGNDLNGITPGFGTDPNGLAAGTVVALRNLVSLPRNPSSVLFDARDRLGSTKGVVMSRSSWATTPGTVLADATEVSATIDWGKSFVMPIGEDEIFPTPGDKSMFEIVSLFVQATRDGTQVQIDADADGSAETTVTLNQGENYYLERGVLKGATVEASKSVQVHLLTGDIGANYESRWFSVAPLDQWGGSYYSPVGTASDGDDAYIFLYNPDSAAITVNFETRVSSGSFSVPGNDTYRFLMPQSSAAHFSSVGEKPFFGIGTVGAKPSSNNVHDWGFSLVPQGNLTTAAVVGWGPGSGDLSVNGSPVWFTAVGPTRVYVDYDGDKVGSQVDPDGDQYDEHFDVLPFEVTRSFDPDKDQTGMRIYTLDGTLITAAWGQDPSVAGPGNPYLDVGTTVPAFPVPVIQKSSAIFDDVGSPGLSLGDTLEYTITMNNQSLVALGNVFVIDELPVQLDYVEGSTERDGVSIPDSANPTTAFPLNESGIVIPVVLRRQKTTITYRALIVGTGTIINNVTTSYAGVSDTNTVSVGSGGTTCVLDFTNDSGVVMGAFAVGDDIYVTANEPDSNTSSTTAEEIPLLVNNDSNGDYEAVMLVETGVDTGVFRNAVALPSSAINGLGPEDGTLNVSASDSLSASLMDPVNGETCSAMATVAVPSLTKQLYLTTDGADSDSTGSLDRIDPVATTDGSQSSTASISAPLSAVSYDGASSGIVASSTSLTFSHVVGSNPDRLLLVGVSLGATSSSGNPPSLTGVTYGGSAMALVGSKVSDTGGSSHDMISYIYRLVNPPTGTADVVVSANGNGVIIAGAASFSNVDQSTPTGSYVFSADSGGSPTVTVSSAANEQVFSTIAWDEGPALTIGSGQTESWNRTGSAPASGAGSVSVGSASTVHGYGGSGSNQDWAISAIAVKPAPASSSVGAIFTQTPALAETLVLPGGSQVGTEIWFSETSGSMPATPEISATLKYGSTVFATSTGATSAGGKLTFSFPLLAADVTIPAGEAVSLEVATAEAGVDFTIDYDSQTKPSVVALPTTTVIHVNSLAVYDAPYPGGSLISTPSNGQTVYVRTEVGDPFGAYDITSLPLSIDGPGASDDISVTLSDANVVNVTAATKTYEYVWNTGSTTGAYTIAATAKEGFEDSITDQKSSSVTLSFEDLGTPSTTEFTTGENGPHTLTYSPDETVCVRITDIDQNLDSGAIEQIPAVITGSAGDRELVTLTETGVDTGVFVFCIPASSTDTGSENDGELYAEEGAFLQVDYVDPDDPGDTGSDTATVPNSSGSPGVNITKVLLAPVDGQVVVGEAVQYRLRTTNTGNTALASVSVTDSFPAANLAFDSSSLAPDSSGSGSLLWNNVGPLAEGQSVDIIVNFTALASADPANNSATADGGGGVTSTDSADVVITNPSITVTKTLVSPTPGPASKGDDVVFEITVLNSGDTAISSLPLEDSYSGSSFDFVSASVPPDATGSGSLLWLDITGPGSLASGASQTITVTLNAKGAANPATNLAAVNFAEDENGDPVPPDDSQVGIEINAASIAGTVLEDRGVTGFGGGDLPIPSVTVKLYTDPDGDGDSSDGMLVGTTTTESDGGYEFLNLALGDYVIVETDPIGFNSVEDTQGANDNRIALELASFGESAGNDFLDVYIDPADYGGITGQVRNDVDADGDLGDGDAGISGVTIELYTDPNGDGNPADGVLFTSTQTNGSGDYSFSLIPPGDYVVVENDPAGFSSTADATMPNDNRIAAGVVASTINSGNDFLDTNNVAALGTIGNQVWIDVDNDGLLDGSETGVGGVVVQLFLGSQTPGVDMPYLTTTSGVGGVYSFSNVPQGDYVVYLPASNFSSGGALQSAPLSSSGAGISDDQVDDDDNGIQTSAGQPVSSPVINVSGGETDDSVDFGFVPNGSLGSVAGSVLKDENNDDTGDSGIGGVQVTLFTDPNGDGDPSDGVVWATAFTATDGSYGISGVPPGAFVVVESQPSGFLDVTDTDGGTDSRVAFVLPPAGTGRADFVEEEPGGISGHLYIDTNGNGTQDSGESDLAGVDVVIADSLGNDQTVSTDGNGDWTASVPPGSTSANVDETDPQYPTGFTQTEGNDPTVVTAVAGVSTDAGIDGYFNPAIVTGHLYIDTNGNGDQDSGEPNLADVDVIVTDSLGNDHTVTTNSTGDWSSSVPPGSASAKIDETDPQYPTGYTQTEGEDPTVVPAVAGASTDAGIDGFFLPGSISGSVFVDTDDDGDADGPLESVLIRLLDATGNPVLDEFDDRVTTSTFANGAYSFGNLPPGSYRVTQDQPANYDSVSDSDGLNDNVIGEETPIMVTAGNDNDGNDFIEIELGSIAGFVRLDTNDDGNGDDVLGGVVLNLLDDSGQPVLDALNAPILATSSGTGFYLFTGIPTGSYRVSQSQPAGYGSVSDVDGANNNLIGDETPIVMTPGLAVTGRDFVEIELGSISGSVLVGSSPLGGVTLTLLDDGGDPVDGDPDTPGVQPITTTSQPDGSYTFADVLPGVYQVGQTQPFGYESVSDLDGGDINIIGDVTPITILPGQDSTGNDFIEKVDTCPDNWAEWKAQHPGEEANGNPDGDDYDNLTEFAFAMDAGSGAGDSWRIEASSTVAGALDAVFTRPKGAPENVVYTLEFASSLGDPVVWSSIEISPSIITGVVDNGDCTETITIADVETVTGLTGGSGVVRIRAELYEENDSVVDHTACTHVEGWTATDFGICCQTYSNPYLRSRVFTGTVDVGGVSGQTLDFTTSAGGIDIGSLLGSGAYFLEVTSGVNEGHRFDVVSANGSIVTLANDADLHEKEAPFNTLVGALPSSLAGAEVEIRNHWTLEEVFPPAAFGAAASELDADQVQIHSGGAWTIYWLGSSGGTPKWVEMGGSMDDRGGTILPPGQGMFYNSRNAPSSLLVYGEIRQNDFRRPLASGTNLVSGGYPMDQSANGGATRELSKSEGFFGSLDFKTADSFFIWRGDASPGSGNYDTYFLADGGSSSPTLLRWIKVGDASATPRDAEFLLLGNRSVFLRSASGLESYGYARPWAP